MTRWAVKAVHAEPLERRLARAAARRPWDLDRPPRIPVGAWRPPGLEAVAPYLRELAQGGLAETFEARLAARYGLPAECVVTVSSAAAGLTLALQAVVRSDGYCLMPAWTHAATAQAARAAGLAPFLVDADLESGQLTPGLAWRALAGAPGPVAAVVAVSPLGRPVDTEAWEEFRLRTGAPVVLDAAGGFDSLEPAAFPAVVSLKAGKVLATGEGGFVVATDSEVVGEIRRRADLGCDGGLEALGPGTEARLAGPAAAYGLAGLDLYHLQRAELQAQLRYYRTALADLPVGLAPDLGEDWVAGAFSIRACEAAVMALEQQLAQAGVATRRWWGQGLRGHAAFRDLAGGPTPATETLAAETIGLPLGPGLSPEDLELVTGLVRQAIGSAPPQGNFQPR